jgi:hypothetical protein
MHLPRSSRRPGLTSLASLIALVATALPAHALFIDFESLALDEVVESQFAADQVVFDNAIIVVAGISLNEFDFPPASGSNVITGLDPGALGVSFLQPAQHVRVQLTTAELVAVRYYDASSALLGEILVAANLGGNTLVDFAASSPLISEIAIASVLGGNAFSLTADDLEVSFEGAIPEPSGFVAMACGFAVLAAALRRRG